MGVYPLVLGYTCHAVIRTCQIRQAFDTGVFVFNALRNVLEFGHYTAEELDP